MKISDKKSIRFVQYKDDGSTGSIDFDWGAIGDSPVFEGEQKEKSEILKRLNNLLEDFDLFYDMTEEELQVFHEKIKYQKSDRSIAEIIKRSNKTVKSRWLKCIGKIGKYFCISSEFNIQKCLQGIQNNNNHSHTNRR